MRAGPEPRATPTEIEMALSNKHYEMIARETKSQVDAYRTVIQQDHNTSAHTANECINALCVLMVALCDNFAAENPRFDRKRFLTACGF